MNRLINELILYIPRVGGAVAIVLVGLILAVVARRFVGFVLRRLGFDQVSERVGVTAVMRQGSIQRSPSHFVGTVIFWAVLVFAVVAAVGALGLQFLAESLSQVVLYGLRALLAILILILGLAAGGLLADIAERGLSGVGVARTSGLRTVVQYAVVFIAMILAAAVLGVDVTILIVVTVIALGAVALTASLAIGLGLRGLSANVAASRYVTEGIAEGERISINGISGRVERVGHAVTTVRGDNGRTYLIPNAHFLENVVEKDSASS